MKHLLKNEDGFSLIELVAAFAVLSIVAVSLLNMFTVSVNVNQNSYKTDRAIAIGTKFLDGFQTMISVDDPVTQFVNDPTYRMDENGGVYTAYYTRNWQKVPSSSTYEYTVEATFTDVGGATSSTTFIDRFYDANLDAVTSTFLLTESGGNLNLSLNGTNVVNNIPVTSHSSTIDIVVNKNSGSPLSTFNVVVSNPTTKTIRIFKNNESFNLSDTFSVTIDTGNVGDVIVNDQLTSVSGTVNNNYSMTLTIKDSNNNVITTLSSHAYGGR